MTDPNREQRLAEVHNASVAFPPRSEVTRYDRLSPIARALVDDYDEIDLAEMLVAAQNAIERARTLHRKTNNGDTCVYCAHGQRLGYDTTWPCDTIRVLDEQVGPAATEATQAEKTTRVLAALHRSAEEDVTRVITLYERWVQAGPPPLGTSVSRWWDTRLAELHTALNPTKEQP